ncbi:hypothetical protein [Nocardia jiangxiensis]|uniref:hypothetical protein n=1 Tax=Nocardia jiangxiensis TaxID=282685 RepID=UPI0002F78943|nr:hypothetical protein [Nocardia jiangxiensis]
MNGTDELFFEQDDLIAALHEIAEDEDLDDDTALAAIRAKLLLFREKWERE